MTVTEEQLLQYEEEMIDLLQKVFGITKEQAYDVQSELEPVVEQLVNDLD